MVRPTRFTPGSRVHVGVKYNRYMIALFDRLADRQGLDRNHAVEICLKAAIQAGRIPDPFFPEVETKMEEEMKRQEAQGAEKLSGARLFSGHSSRSNGPVKKGSKITQSL